MFAEPRVATLCAAASRAAASGMASDKMAEVAALAEQLDCADLGLKLPKCLRQSRAATSSSAQIIHTQMIFSSPQLELVIFLFPAGARIPLHDHPNMYVFSKVMYGSLAMQSFDWASERPPAPNELDALSDEQEELLAAGRPVSGSQCAFAARQVADTILNPEAPTMLLKPSFANIHAFQAQTECAVLDLLMPPYDCDVGRECHYFAADETAGETASAKQHRAQLRVIAAPPDLHIRKASYAGPKVVL